MYISVQYWHIHPKLNQVYGTSEISEKLLIKGEMTKKPKDWKVFLSNDDNKKQLIQVILNTWSSDDCIQPDDHTNHCGCWRPSIPDRRKDRWEDWGRTLVLNPRGDWHSCHYVLQVRTGQWLRVRTSQESRQRHLHPVTIMYMRWPSVYCSILGQETKGGLSISLSWQNILLYSIQRPLQVTYVHSLRHECLQGNWQGKAHPDFAKEPKVPARSCRAWWILGSLSILSQWSGGIFRQHREYHSWESSEDKDTTHGEHGDRRWLTD